MYCFVNQYISQQTPLKLNLAPLFHKHWGNTNVWLPVPGPLLAVYCVL